MVYIVQLPVIPVKEQVCAVVDILDSMLPMSTPRGIQIFRGCREVYDPSDTGKIVVDLVQDHVPAEYHISLHAPFAAKSIVPFYRCDVEESKKMLHENFDLARSIGAKDLIIHAGTVFYHPRASIPPEFEAYRWKNMTSSERKNVTVTVCKNISDVARRYPDISLHVENMPAPISFDTSDVKKCFLDPLLNSYISILDFFRILHEQSDIENIGLCFDTNHYLRTVSTLRMNDTTTALQEALQGVKQDKHDNMLTELNTKDLRWIAEQLPEEIISVQVSDTIAWIQKGAPTRALSLKEGPHWEEIKEFLKILKKQNAHYERTIPLSFDIDEQDYIARPHQRESLELFLDEVGI